MLQHVLWNSIHNNVTFISLSASAAAAGLLRELFVLQPCLSQHSNRQYSSSSSSSSSNKGHSSGGGSRITQASIINYNEAAALLQVACGGCRLGQQHTAARPVLANGATDIGSCSNDNVTMCSNHSSSSTWLKISSTCCRSISCSTSSSSSGSMYCRSTSGCTWSSSSMHSSSCSEAWCTASNKSSLGSWKAGSSPSSSSSIPVSSWCQRGVCSSVSWSGGSLGGSSSSSSKSQMIGGLGGSKGLGHSWTSSLLGITCSSCRSITCKPHHPPRDFAEDSQQQQLEGGGGSDAAKQQQLAHLRHIMEDAGLSFPALMSVLQHHQKRPLNPGILPGRLKQLQDIFGPSQANDMLTLAAYLLERDPQRLKAHYDGLVTLMGAGEKYVADLIKRAPDLLQHNPALLQGKLQLLQDMMQLDHKSLLRLVKKAPAIIKMHSSKVRAQLDFFAEAGGLQPHDVFKVYTSWPVMASTSLSLVKARYMALSELLQASPEDMSRICRTFTNLLGRDPNQLDTNITTLANKLGIPKEQMLHFVCKEPGLLSWNVSTLITRVMAVSQMLKLPQDKALTLLSYNRPLLSNTQALPRRLELLQKVLRVTESELLALVHKALPVLRFPVNTVEAKLACVLSLVHLHQVWKQEWPHYTPLTRVRMIQAGWSCHWRLVYLLQSGQQHSIPAMAALRMPHGRFQKLYPDYPNWLNRYNQSVHGQNIPVLDPALLSSSSSSVTLQGPACYEAVLLDASQGASWHAGSLFIRDREAALKRQVLFNRTLHDLSSSSSSSNDGGGSGVGAVGYGIAGDISSTRSAAASAVATLPCTPAGRLAAWLRIEISQAQQLLSLPAMQKLTWAAWQAKLDAAAKLLNGVGRKSWAAPVEPGAYVGTASAAAAHAYTAQQGPVQHTAHTTRETAHAAGEPAVDKSSKLQPVSSILQPVSRLKRSRRQLRRSAAQPADRESSSSSSSSESSRHQGLARGPGAVVAAAAAAHSRVAAAVDEAQLNSPLLGTGQQQEQQQVAPVFAQLAEQMLLQHAAVQQQVQHSTALHIQPPPEAQEALACALASGQSQAVAAVTVACLLAPFAHQLYHMPPRPPDAVVQFVVQHPEVFVREPFEATCNTLAALAQASPYMCSELRGSTSAELAAYTACLQTRLRYVQYLVDTQQPTPWVHTLRAVLVSNSWYKSKGALGGKETFTAAYPGYQQWEQAMQKL